MSGGWGGSDRRERLPADWPQKVAFVKERDGHRCTWKLPSGARCPRAGTEVDHRLPGDDHGYENLRLLCKHHHAKKSAQEGVQGRRARRPSVKRPEERHPGLVWRP